MANAAERPAPLFPASRTVPPNFPRREKVPMALRVTERDSSILCAIALGRFLSFEQLYGVFFKGASEAVAKKRLRELCGGGRSPARPPLLKSIAFRKLDGHLGTAFVLTDHGYALAADKLGRAVHAPQSRGTVEFIVHQLGLNEVLIGLAMALHAASGSKAPWPDFRKLSFVWHPGHMLHLNWTETVFQYDQRVPVRRLLVPDAILELPAQRRRLFLEYETGAHPVVSANPSKKGASIHKALRYGRYICRVDGQGRTHYGRTFPDGFTPELVFVAARETRAKHIAEALRRAQKKQDVHADVVMRALTAEQLVAQELPRAPGVKPKAPPPSTESVLRVFRRYFLESLTALKSARAQARDVTARHNLQLEVPPYPASTTEAKALLDGAGTGER